MHILLLGNGFDLYHKLPTKYNNFLNTVDFLLGNYTPDMKTIGDVFGSKDLQQNDSFIQESYQKYQDIFNNVELDDSKIKELLELMTNNIWFKYLVKSFNKDVGWIDFEKEIALVVDAFRQFLDEANVNYKRNLIPRNETARYIIQCFDFFSEPVNHSSALISHIRRIKKIYTIEVPLGSSIFIINKEKIIEDLAKSLGDLAKGLQLYLLCFIENTLEDLQQADNFEYCKALEFISDTVTLNYTNTYEKLYSNNHTFHRHGNVYSTIVLGINSDDTDELENTDTSFIVFKKYFQRVMYTTDIEYSRWITELYEEKENTSYTVTVMGHSLDITDEDIIHDLFTLADEIIVLYHDEGVKASYIANLVKMYGRKEFEMLRSKQKLTFVSLDSDLTWISEKRRLEADRQAFLEGFLGEDID